MNEPNCRQCLAQLFSHLRKRIRHGQERIRAVDSVDWPSSFRPTNPNHQPKPPNKYMHNHCQHGWPFSVVLLGHRWPRMAEKPGAIDFLGSRPRRSPLRTDQALVPGSGVQRPPPAADCEHHLPRLGASKRLRRRRLRLGAGLPTRPPGSKGLWHPQI